MRNHAKDADYNILDKGRFRDLTEFLCGVVYLMVRLIGSTFMFSISAFFLKKSSMFTVLTIRCMTFQVVCTHHFSKGLVSSAHNN